jgi:uncharacterized repeat protein (TIGR01451 family)
MYQAIWKLTALAVVVGIGVVVVVQAQRGFNNVDQKQDPLGVPAETTRSDTDSDFDTLSSQAEPEQPLEGFDDESPTVPASAKTNSLSRRKEHSTIPEDDDPFADSKKPLDGSARRAAPQSDTRERTAARNRPRLAAADDELTVEKPSSSTRELEQSDNDDPFSDESRRKPNAPATKPAKSSRGPALRLNSLTDEDQETIGASASESTDDKQTSTGPKLLGDDDDATSRLSPISGDDADPFGDDAPAARRAPATDPSVAKVDDEDDVPDSSKYDEAPRKLPKPIGPPSSNRESAEDEMPIIERAAPQRKPATPAVPRADEEADDDADAFPAIGRKRADKQEPRRLPPDREASIPLDDEPATQPEKTPSRTRPDPFADDETDGGIKTLPTRRKADDQDEAVTRGRPAAPLFEDDDKPVAAPKGRSSTRPALDDEDTIELGAEPQQKRPEPSSALRDDAPVVEAPAKESDDEAIRRSPLPAVESRPAPRRTPQPQLTIDKIAPPTAVLGKPMVYQIVVKNVGPIAARQVVVEDAVPDAARIDGSIPQALLENQHLIWKLGTLEAGREKKILVRMIPQAEGTLGTVATVNCASGADGARSVAAPQLKFDVITPSQAVVGTPVALKFRVTNVGEVDASGVVIRNVLPAGLRHPDGDDLEYEIGALPAGKVREVELTLTAGQAGKTVNRAIVTADGNVTEEASASLDIVGPALSLARSGTKRLFPGKTGNYTNTITNPGSTPVANVRVVETIPPGMEFASASDGGQYDAAKRSVTWSIERLAPQEVKTLTIKLSSSSRGARISVVRAYDASGASGETVGTTHVAGVPALTIDIGELAPHLEIGEQIRIPIRVINRGSDAATGIRTSVTLPTGMELVSINAPVDYKVERDQALREKVGTDVPGVLDRLSGDPIATVIRFAPIKRLDARADAMIELTLKAREAGNARLRVEVECEQITEPVRREEVTTVAATQE